MPTTKLPDGYRIEREETSSGERVYFFIYKDGYTWKTGEPRPYHVVNYWPVSKWNDGPPEISTASSSDKSVELAVCLCEALAMAIREAQTDLEAE